MKIPDINMSIYPPFEGFPVEGIKFLNKLKRNNNRNWFLKHKAEYEGFVKLPMQSYISDLKSYFAEFAPEYDLNPKSSIFRINRDVRFSTDKTPYKTHIAAHFVLPNQPKGYIGSGYYIEIGTSVIYVGGGIYIPTNDQLRRIRNAIATRGDEFISVVKNRRFKKLFEPFEWEKLKRIPKGFDENHPMADWLKFKQFYVGVTWNVKKCYRKSFLKESAQIFKEVTPLVKFLNSC